ncbi:MAG: PRD domain-containing protein [Bulleidia sp.]|nr:PRD domain-containing protein [Bulleidia sp.]
MGKGVRAVYRICKVLNHSGVIAFDMQDSNEYVLLGKGVGFGRKVGERLEKPEDCTVYSLQATSTRGSASELARSIEPEYLEMANRILNLAEKQFGMIDRSILFPMADHIAFAVKRMQKGEQISNPLTPDIQTLFNGEFKVALTLKEYLKKEKGIDVPDDEIGYVALHIHSALEKESVAVSMQMASAVRECVSLIEEQRKIHIDVTSLSYNRLMNHVKFMVARALNKESLKVNMNEYVEHNFPRSYELARIVCDHLSQALRVQLEEIEVGYLALHIERVSVE